MIPALGPTIEIVDESGKVLSSGKSIFRALQDAKAAYHARKAEILAERAMQRAAREGAALGALEREARRAERHQKRLEYQTKVEKREAKKEGDHKTVNGNKMKSIGSDVKVKEKEKRKKDDKKEKLSGKELVVYRGGKEKRKGGKREEEEKKHKHQGSNRKRKDSMSSSSSTPPTLEKEEPSTAIDIVSPPTPLAEELDPKSNGRNSQALVPTSESLALIDPDENTPLSTLLNQMTNILDTLDCLNASMAALMTALQKDPGAVGVVAYKLAQIAKVVAFTTPSVLLPAKAAFPVIFALLASPQFIFTAGSGMIVLGGYIIRAIYGGGAAPAPSEEPENEHVEDKDDCLAYERGMEDAHGEAKGEIPAAKPKKLEGPTRAMTLPARLSSPSDTPTAVDPVPTQQAPPIPQKKPLVKAKEKEAKKKDPKKSKRHSLKRSSTTKN